jgi:hypothetical protein
MPLATMRICHGIWRAGVLAKRCRMVPLFCCWGRHHNKLTFPRVQTQRNSLRDVATSCTFFTITRFTTSQATTAVCLSLTDRISRWNQHSDTKICLPASPCLSNNANWRRTMQTHEKYVKQKAFQTSHSKTHGGPSCQLSMQMGLNAASFVVIHPQECPWQRLTCLTNHSASDFTL